jgi:cytochrome c oxidase assembly protein subunit 15
VRVLAIVSLLLALALITLSAYLRLDHSGIGCEPWPQCYGNIGIAAEEGGVSEAYQRLLDDTHQPLSWATPAHRLVASVLGLLIVALCLLALLNRRDRTISFLLLLLTVFLALLGVRSGGLHDPAVVFSNLTGGFAMLGLLGWLVFKSSHGKAYKAPPVRRWSLLALVVLCIQISLGALTSANFAASACRTLPDCHGSWLPGSHIATAFDLSRKHQVGETGMVIGGPERADIHKLHRLTAIVVAGLALLAGFMAVRAGPDLPIIGSLVIGLVVMEFAIGVAAIATELPITLALAHNSLAALLLLAILKLLADSQTSSRLRL